MKVKTPAFELQSRWLGALPIVNHFLRRLRLGALLVESLAPPGGRCLIPPALSLLTLLRNLVLERTALYSLSEWAAGVAPRALGLAARQTAALNDDRVGRALDDLFDCDRGALLTGFVIHMVKEFKVDLSQLHNDSTSLTMQGVYHEGDGRRVRGKATPRIAFGYNKDHRPDLRQLLWILTVSADGAVPVCFKVADGNVEDSTTHADNWELLRRLVGGPGFLYVADSKLCVPEVLRHIDGLGGCFLTPLPRSRREDALFREWLRGNAPDWREAGRRPVPGGEEEVIRAMESPVPEANGFRLIWFLSSRKLQLDARKRQDALLRADRRLAALKARLEAPRCRFKRLKTVAKAVEAILVQTRTAGWIDYRVEQKNQIVVREEKQNNPKRPVRLRSFWRSKFLLTWTPNLKAIRDDSLADGVSPLVTNRPDLSPWAVHAAYHGHQAFLEKRHDLLKNTLRAAPPYLHSVSRLDAFLLLEYLALTVHALIERELRRKMSQRGIPQIPLYPELRPCQAPTAARLFEVFDRLETHTLSLRGKHVQTFPPLLTPVQRDLLALLDIPEDVYLSNNQ